MLFRGLAFSRGKPIPRTKASPRWTPWAQRARGPSPITVAESWPAAGRRLSLKAPRRQAAPQAWWTRL